MRAALGQPMLYHPLKRLRAVESLDDIEFAATTHTTHSPFVDRACGRDVIIERTAGRARMPATRDLIGYGDRHFYLLHRESV